MAAITDTIPNTRLPAAGKGLTLNNEYYLQEPARWSGQEITYAERTTDLVVTATTAAGANTVVTAPAVEYDGKVILIEFFTSRADPPDADSAFLVFNLWDQALAAAAADIGRIWLLTTTVAAIGGSGVHAARRLTPTKGAHIYSVRCWRSTGVPDGTVYGGIGGTDEEVSAFIRITRAGTQTP
jgi:hypothetical protein